MLTEVGFQLAGCDGEQPLIVVPTYVNDKGPYDFILDTGAGISLVSSALAHRLGITAMDSEERTGAGGKIKVLLGRVRSLAIGEARLGLDQVRISDELERISAAVGQRIYGDIGYDYLKHFRVTIDYREGTLGLAQEKQEPEDVSTSACAEVEFKLANPAKPLVLVPTFVNGTGPYQFALDTGASSTVVSPELTQNLGIASVGVGTGIGAGGEIQVSACTVESLGVGDAELTDLLVVVADFLGMLSQVVGEKLDGVVGYNYLREFRVTIDYPNQLLRLE